MRSSPSPVPLLLLLLACGPDPAGSGTNPDEGAGADGGDEGSDGESDDTGGGDDGSQDTAEDVVDEAWCAEPADAVTYTAVGEAWDLLDTATDSTRRKETNPIALADFDGDGDDDLLLGDDTLGLWYHRNDGGSFTRSLVLNMPGLVSLGIGDIDGDHDLDVVSTSRQVGVALFINDGSGGFTDQSATGLAVLGSNLNNARDATLSDADGDGDMDLLLVTANVDESPDAERHRLLLNDGTGVFSDASDRLPDTARSGLGWQGVWFDLEGDGDPDLFLAHAEQNIWGPSALVRNDGEAGFTDITEDCYCGETGSNMGASAGDIDGDGLLDLFITNTGPSPLLQNLGDGSFVDVAKAMGATVVPDGTWMTFGSVFFDRENDGDLDILTTTGPLGEGGFGSQPPNQPDALLERQGEVFVDVAPELGLADEGAGRGIGVGFLNSDGFPDLVVNHVGTASEAWLASCTDARALVIELEGPGANTFGVGARVVVETSEGTQVREITTRAGWASAAHPRAWFGLGDARVRSVVITWPDGHVQDLDLQGTLDRRMTVVYE